MHISTVVRGVPFAKVTEGNIIRVGVKITNYTRA